MNLMMKLVIAVLLVEMAYRGNKANWLGLDR